MDRGEKAVGQSVAIEHFFILQIRQLSHASYPVASMLEETAGQFEKSTVIRVALMVAVCGVLAGVALLFVKSALRRRVNEMKVGARRATKVVDANEWWFMKPLAMVVGASRRVGREVALELARAGFDLVLTFHSDQVGAQETQSMAVDLGSKVTLLQLDLDDTDTALAKVGALALHTLDALIVSAGLWEKDVAHGTDGAQAERFMRVNCITPTSLARMLSPALARSTRAGGASVMAFGDIHVDFRPMKEFTHYLASKRALHAWFRNLALELAPRIRVNVIIAGVIAWPQTMGDAQYDTYVRRVPLGRVGTPKDAAALVRFVTVDAPFMTGSAITLDGGRSLVEQDD